MLDACYSTGVDGYGYSTPRVHATPNHSTHMTPAGISRCDANFFDAALLR